MTAQPKARTRARLGQRRVLRQEYQRRIDQVGVSAVIWRLLLGAFVEGATRQRKERTGVSNVSVALTAWPSGNQAKVVAALKGIRHYSDAEAGDIAFKGHCCGQQSHEQHVWAGEMLLCCVPPHPRLLGSLRPRVPKASGPRVDTW